METIPEKPNDLRSVRLLSVKDLPKDFKVHTDVRRWNPIIRIPVISRYIISEIIGPFMVSLTFFTFIYMVMAVQKMVGLIVGKGVEFSRLLDYLGYLLGNTLPSTIPMACLMSGIMAAGRLSGDSEITAMRSAGISYSKIYSNFLAFGFVAGLVVAYLNFYLGPDNTRKMNEFNNWIIAYNPLLAVTPGQFSGDQVKQNFATKAKTMYTEGMNRDTGEMKNIQIREWEIFAAGNDFLMHNGQMIQMGGSRVTQIISAKSGHVVEKLNIKNEYEKGIRLRDGFVIEWNEKKDGMTITNFIGGEMDYNLPKEETKKVIGFNIKPETFSFPELISIKKSIESEGLENIPGLELLKENGIQIKGVNGFKDFVTKMKLELINCATNNCATSEEMNNRYAILTQLDSLQKESLKVLMAFDSEIHKRIATPVSCWIFFFLSFPLGLFVRRSGKGMSFTLAIIILLLYYAVFISGSSVSYKSGIPAWIGVWTANIMTATVSLYVMVSRTDIQVKESFAGKIFFKIAKPINKLLLFLYNKTISPILIKLNPTFQKIVLLSAKIAKPIIKLFLKIKNKFVDKQ
jgi:lipopolysaccharide export system permease protein